MVFEWWIIEHDRYIYCCGHLPGIDRAMAVDQGSKKAKIRACSQVTNNQ